MSEPKDLLLIVEQLRRSNRRWKALALAACFALILAALVGLVATSRQRVQTEAALRLMNETLANAEQALVNTQRAANPGQPR